MYDLQSKTETQISQNLTSGEVSISDDAIVWSDNASGRAYYFDLKKKKTSPISKVSSNQGQPSIFGDKVVWVDDRDSESVNGMGNAIYIHDLKSGKETSITNFDNVKSSPDIYDNFVVWEYTSHEPSCSHASENIEMINIKTGKETIITNTPCNLEENPRIWGNNIVWEDRTDYNNPNIMLYNISSQKTTRLTPQGGPHIGLSPAIYGDNVVWQDNELNYYSDIVEYNIRTGQKTWITDDAVSQLRPAIYQNKIVWQDYRNGEADIYMATIK